MTLERKPEPAQPHAPQSVIFVARAAAVLLTFVLASTVAAAQAPGPQAPPSPPANAAAPPPAPNPVDAFGNFVRQGGHLMQEGVASMGTGFGQMIGAIGGQANGATGDAADAARNAAAAVSRLPNTGITTGHERCIIAPNGAPDCGVAAATLCRAKGYANGTSIDFVTIENCPPPYRTSRDAPEGVCTMEHYVTKAVCQ